MIKTENYNKIQKAKHAINYLIVFVSCLVLLSCGLEGVNSDGNTIRRPSSTVPLTFRPVHPYANPLWGNSEGDNNNRLQIFSDELRETVIEIREVNSNSLQRRPVPCFLNFEVELDSGGEGSIEMIPSYWLGPATGIGDRVLLEITGKLPNGEEFKADGSFPLLPVEIIGPAEIPSVAINDNNTDDDPADDTVSPELIPLDFEVRGIERGQMASVTIVSTDFGSLAGDEDINTVQAEVLEETVGEDVVYKINVDYFPKPVVGRQEITLSFALALPAGITQTIAENRTNLIHNGDYSQIIHCTRLASSGGTEIERSVSIIQRAALPQPTTPTAPAPGG